MCVSRPSMIWLFLLAPVWAVYVGWPMDEQLPNVARVDEAYLFTLASITYRSSSGGSISYSASNLPGWLSFDSESRTFSGTPSGDDVGQFQISLAATDSADGSSAENSYSMMVSNSSGLSLSSSDVMFTSIAQYGQTNGVNGLVVKEGEHFSIQFDDLVFVENAGASRPISYYYGRSMDRTSLPNWISFDSSSNTFSGSVPYVTSDIAPSVLYGFSFIGSDYQGYAGAEGIFYLVVGAHQLSTLLNESIKVNGTYGLGFEYDVPVLSSVYLDSEVISSQNISSVSANDLPSYIDFDDKDYALKGTFPNSSTFDNFTIVVADVYGNLVDLPYSFSSIGSVFTVHLLPDVNATKTEYFLYQLLRSYFTDYNETAIDVSFNSSDWLSYHSLNLTLSGIAPKNLDAVEVTVKASSSFDSHSLSFRIVGVDKDMVTSSSSLSSSSATSSASHSASQSASQSSSAASATSTTASSSSIAASQKKSSENKKKLVLGLAIGIPAFVILLAALLLLFCCCRRKKDHDTESDKSAPEPELTGPGFGVTYDMDDSREHARQLGALNALKLDNDNSSTLSSLTHVDSEAESNYYDASEKPVKSWRANDTSDSNAIKQSFLLLQKHTSQLSLDTVNTEQLFSVKLVDGSRDSFPSPTKNFLGHAIARDTLSGNIQRLDSDGNIANDGLMPVSPTRSQRPISTNLNNINEEEDTSNNTFYNTSNESSNYNLMAKFLNGGSSFDNDVATRNSFDDDFEPTRTSVDYVGWRPSQEARSLEALVESPDSATFLINNEPTPKNNLGALTGNSKKNQSTTSLYSDMSDTMFDNKRGSKAKLVDFTRKGSLREAAHTQNVEHLGETAQIHDGDSD